MISSLGMLPCSVRLKAISTQGRYGALNTNNPRKLNLVSGLRRDQIYTRVEERGCPRNGIDTIGESRIRQAMA